MTIVIKEIPSAELGIIWPFIQQLNPTMEHSTFLSRLEPMIQANYRCAGAYEGDTLVGICGFWVNVQLWCGAFVELDNFCVDETRRGQNIGVKLMDFIETIAKSEGCQMAWIKTYTHNTRGHRFFYRQGYIIRGFGFTKDL